MERVVLLKLWKVWKRITCPAKALRNGNVRRQMPHPNPTLATYKKRNVKPPDPGYDSVFVHLTRAVGDSSSVTVAEGVETEAALMVVGVTQQTFP